MTAVNPSSMINEPSTIHIVCAIQTH